MAAAPSKPTADRNPHGCGRDPVALQRVERSVEDVTGQQREIKDHQADEAKDEPMDQLCNRRETKRTQTSLRLQQCAIQMTIDHGFDGWTIDDLAEAANVSRRTVFNYFDGKADVVLGPVVELDPERVAMFVAGGPSGNLLTDALALTADVIEERTSDQKMVATGRNAVLGDARLIGLAHQRFENITSAFVELVRERDGESYNPGRVRLLSRLVVTLFDSAVERAEADPGRPFAEHFDTAVRDARDVLA